MFLLSLNPGISYPVGLWNDCPDSAIFYPEPLPHPDVWSADARQYIFDQWRMVRTQTLWLP